MSESILSQNTDAQASEFGFVFHPPAGGLILLEQVAADAGCISHGRPLMKAINHDQKRAVLFRPRCKLWSCPTCAQINVNKWLAAVLHGSNVLTGQGAVLDFFTVTSHEKLSPGATIRVLPSAWDKLRKRLGRAADAEYFIIPEQHKNGRLHLHGIVSAHLGKRWWKDNARGCGLGYMSDAQEVKNIGGVAGYVSKYLVKTLEFSNWAKGFHRVRPSQGWPKLPVLEKPDGWSFMLVAKDAILSEEVQRLADGNYVVAVFEHAAAWDFVNTDIE